FLVIEEATRVTEEKIKIIAVAGKLAGPPPPPPVQWLREQGDIWESVLLNVGQRYRVQASASIDGKKISVRGGFVFKKLEDGTFENTNKQTGLSEKCLNDSAPES